MHLRAWKYDVRGRGRGRGAGHLLDSDLPENSDWDRRDRLLYGGDARIGFVRKSFWASVACGCCAHLVRQSTLSHERRARRLLALDLLDE